MNQKPSCGTCITIVMVLLMIAAVLVVISL